MRRIQPFALALSFALFSVASAAPLVVYSNSTSDGRAEWLTQQAASQGFDLKVVDIGGGDLTNRLIAEKNNPIADVTFGLNNVFFENLKTAGVLEAYKPKWAGQVNAGMNDKEGTFWPIVREPVMLVYNKAAYPNGKGAPTDWSDLWQKPEFKNRYEVPSKLGGATTRMVLAGILSRYRDPKGELGISDAGWQAVKAYFANGSPSVAGNDLYARMKSGKVNAGQMWLAGKITREKQYGIATAAVRPRIGVPMVVQHVALVKGSKNTTEAKRFIDWFGSAPVQAAWSKKFFTEPTNRAAIPAASTEAVGVTNGFKSQPIDWKFVADNLDKWLEKIELEYLR